jgi:hypothetical protein
MTLSSTINKMHIQHNATMQNGACAVMLSVVNKPFKISVVMLNVMAPKIPNKIKTENIPLIFVFLETNFKLTSCFKK